jgi:hypothetical protein
VVAVSLSGILPIGMIATVMADEQAHGEGPARQHAVGFRDQFHDETGTAVRGRFRRRDEERRGQQQEKSRALHGFMGNGVPPAVFQRPLVVCQAGFSAGS